MSEEDVLEVIDTRLMKPYKYQRVVYQGYMFHFQRKGKTQIRWKCCRLYKASCQAVLRTTLDMERPRFIQLDREHSHENDADSINQLKMRLQFIVDRLNSSFD